MEVATSLKHLYIYVVTHLAEFLKNVYLVYCTSLRLSSPCHRTQHGTLQVQLRQRLLGKDSRTQLGVGIHESIQSNVRLQLYQNPNCYNVAFI